MGYSAFIRARVVITGISEGFERKVFKGFEGFFGAESQDDHLSEVRVTWKAPMRKAALAAFSGTWEV
jgi:hypothetical protein